MINLDDWQKEVLKEEGNIVLRSGRQVGKSTIIGIKAGDFAVNNSNKTILIISATERQAYFLFEKTLAYLFEKYKKEIKTGKDKPTKSKLMLKNGSIIYSLPCGFDGHGLRGMTIDLLIADEGAFVPDDVWSAITPMLATTKGKMILLSTPHGKQGYFYERFTDNTFRNFHISSEECTRVDKEFLKREKERMSNVQYAQEYLGEFVDELRQFFPTEIIKKCMVLEKRNPKGHSKYLGIDVARMGEDDTAFISLEKDRDNLYQFQQDIYQKTYMTDIVRMTKELDKKFNYSKIYIDDGGIGVGVYDPLREDEQTKRKIVSVNHLKRASDYEATTTPEIKERKTKLMKEALYMNLLNLMEKGKIKLFQSPELLQSLKCIQYEYMDNGNIKIFGNYSHLTEALIRACWCVKDKTLNLYVYY